MKKIIISIFVLVILLTGCGNQSDTFTYLINKGVESIDPVDASYTQTFRMFANIYLGPLQIDGDSQLIPGSANSVDVSDDGLTYTLNLRDDVHWVDSKGKDMGVVTAEDYVSGYRRMVDPEEASIFSYILEIIDNATEIINGEMDPESLGVKAVDDYTVEITLDHVAPYFESMLAFGSFVPQPTAALEKYGDEFGSSADTAWYNGAYYISSYEKDYLIEMKKNPLYIGSDHVQLDSIDYRVNEDSSARYNAFINGEADYAEIATAEDYSQAKSDGIINDHLSSATYYAVLNASDTAVTKDIDLRKGLAYGFDRNNMVDAVYGEINKPIEYIIPAEFTNSAYEGVDYHTYAGDSLITYDKDKADKYFDAYMEKMGYSDRKQIEVELLASADESGNSKFAEVLKGHYLQNFGITINISVEPFQQFLESKKSGAFDMYLQSWIPDFADPSTYLSLWQTSQIGSQNYAGYSNPEFDQLYNKAVSETDVDTRFTEFAKLEKMIVDDAVAIPFYQANAPYLVTDGYSIPFNVYTEISNEYITNSNDN